MLSQEEITKLAEENHDLIYWAIHRYNLYPVDDWYDILAIGYMKACNNFDPDRGVQFSTYCVYCMLNEVRLENRKKKVYAHYLNYPEHTSSLDEVISTADDSITLAMMLEDKKNVGWEDEIIFNEMMSHVELSDRESEVLSLRLHGMKHREIAEIIGIAQPTVSRILKRCAEKLDIMKSK